MTEQAKDEAAIARDLDERVIPQLEEKVRQLDENIELWKVDKLNCEEELARLRASRSKMLDPSALEPSPDGETLPDPPRRGPGRPRRS